MAHSSTLAWKIPWMEEPGRLQSMGSLESDTTERLHFHFSLSCIGEGNGNPLQCSCLENPRDGGAWWAAVYGVAQIWTRLKRLSSSSIFNFAEPHISTFWIPRKLFFKKRLIMTLYVILSHLKINFLIFRSAFSFRISYRVIHCTWALL